VDLRLYLRVIWRFRLLVFGGLAVAILLAGISFFRISFAGGTPEIHFRQAQTYQATESLLITTQGGALYKTSGVGATLALGELALQYAEVATSDPVLSIARQSGPLRGTITAKPGADQLVGRTPLPFVEINGLATNAGRAISLARRGSQALQQYVDQQQNLHGVPNAERVVLQVASAATGATVVQGRRKTVPIVVFLTVMIATLGLVFILENLRPRVAPMRIREVDEEEERRERIGRGA
jgi:hypothetical protein